MPRYRWKTQPMSAAEALNSRNVDAGALLATARLAADSFGGIGVSLHSCIIADRPVYARSDITQIAGTPVTQPRFGRRLSAGAVAARPAAERVQCQS